MYIYIYVHILSIISYYVQGMWIHIQKSMHAYVGHTWIYLGTCFDSNIVVECKTWSEARHLKSHRLILPVFIGSEVPTYKQSAGWNVELLLDSIIEASHQGRCNALIDTGALITGLTNQEVGGHGRQWKRWLRGLMNRAFMKAGEREEWILQSKMSASQM